MLKHVNVLMQGIIIMLLGCIKTLLLPTVFISINAPLTFYEKKVANATKNGFRTLAVLYVCPNSISFLGLVNCSTPGALIRINTVILHVDSF